MAEQRNAEIWSTRLQKELLALTTDNAPKKETEEVAGVLPAFIKVKEHSLSIENGTCKVSFEISVAKPSSDETTEDETTNIILVLDASLSKKVDGSLDPAGPAYPFKKPKAFLLAGAEQFPEGSTVKDGNLVDIDCDWTPSLHLSDAVLNVGLKVKESILQGEPFYPAPGNEDLDPVDDLVKGAKRFGDFISKSAGSLAHLSQNMTPSKGGRKKKNKRASGNSEVRIGDEINLVEAPWVDCQGLYSCKAIRRPQFVVDAIELAKSRATQSGESNTKFQVDGGEVPEDFGKFMKMQAGNLGKVAGAGFAGAGAMIRSFTQSAKSVLEESFLMITDTHIIELRSSKLNLSVGTGESVGTVRHRVASPPHCSPMLCSYVRNRN